MEQLTSVKIVATSGVSNAWLVYGNIQSMILYMDRKAECLIQFKVNEEAETFEIFAFEIDGEGQDRMVIAVLVEEMFK